MVGWHHPFNGHELGQTLGDGEGQEGLAGCSPWSHKELDMTGRLNNNNYWNIKIEEIFYLYIRSKYLLVYDGFTWIF